jgi:uncharacterized protein (DUF1015 family)
MADVRPFCALRPADHLASRVIAPPYDVLTASEAKDLAENRLSFVRITRSEVDLDDGVDAHSEAAYQQARKTLDTFVADGTLMQDQAPTYYLYGQVMGRHQQLGILAAASVDEYDNGAIKKHEFTRPDKEDDRTHHMDVLDAQVGLVFLTYPAHDGLAALMKKVSANEPVWRVTTEDEVEHTLWPVPLEWVASFQDAFAQISTLYIADGHHRSAAASRIHATRQTEASAHFLVGLYPDNQLQVLPYNRVINDLNGLSQEAFLQAVSNDFDLSPAQTPAPKQRGHVHMYISGAWLRMVPKEHILATDDPVARLDVARLQDRVLGPLLGIDDPRRSTRVQFVGGIRGHEALSQAVDNGSAVAFHLYPTGLGQLFEVADANLVMPPKSTWFEPKLREGVVIRVLT